MNPKLLLTATCTAILLSHVPGLIAQTPAPTPVASSGDKMADARQRMNDRLKAALKVADDEWPVIEPLLERVETAQRATMLGRISSSSLTRHTHGIGDTGASNRSSGSPEADALRMALESDGTSTDEIKARLQALRDAHNRANANLAQAREDLKKVLTVRQEATLVEMGLLE